MFGKLIIVTNLFPPLHSTLIHVITFPGVGEGSVASWELRVEGRLLEDSKSDPNKVINEVLLSFFFSGVC